MRKYLWILAGIFLLIVLREAIALTKDEKRAIRRANERQYEKCINQCFSSCVVPPGVKSRIKQ